MLRPVHVDPHATAFFAVGQFATGFVAFGQFATGVIAVGQFARGLFALGQFSAGLFSAGMFTAGVFGGAGAGVGGRGRGVVLSLVPTVGPPRVAPATTAIAALDEAGAGWVHVTLRSDGATFSIAEVNAARGKPIKLLPALCATVRRALREGERDALAFVHLQEDGTLGCSRLMRVPRPAWEKAGFAQAAGLKTAGLLALALAFWLAVGLPLVHDLR